MNNPVRKDRKNDTCDMQAWYYQTSDKTLAYAVLKGEHGVRKDIPALRIYYIASGEAEFTINGTIEKVSSGTIIEIPPHATYNFRSVGDDPVKLFVDIGFKLDLVSIPS
jgi:mannose-6-phosphate isomerase-like protein (cupin superfamily)